MRKWSNYFHFIPRTVSVWLSMRGRTTHKPSRCERTPTRSVTCGSMPCRNQGADTLSSNCSIRKIFENRMGKKKVKRFLFKNSVLASNYNLHRWLFQNFKTRHLLNYVQRCVLWNWTTGCTICISIGLKLQIPFFVIYLSFWVAEGVGRG